MLCAGAGRALQGVGRVGLGVARRAFSSAPAAEPAPWSFTPAGRNHLFVPGPTNINDRVLRAMNIQGMNHRDPSFGGLVEGLLEDLKYLYKTDSGTPFIFPATGTGAWESALVNCLSPGDKVVAFRK